MWTAIAAVGGAVLGGAIQGNAAEDAAETQAGAAGAATAEQRRQFDISREDLAPFRQAGSSAVNRLSDLLGIGDPNERAIETDPRFEELRQQVLKDSDALHQQTYGMSIFDQRSGLNTVPGERERFNDLVRSQTKERFQQLYGSSPQPVADFGALNRRFSIEDFENDPVNKLGFQFGLDEGTKGIRRMFGASGMARSGAAVKALTRFGTDYAGSKANDSYNRFYADQDRTFNRLSGVAGTGQTATTTTAQLGANMATNVGNNIIGAGNARGAASIAQGNAMSQPFQVGSNMLQTRFLLDSMNRPSQTTRPPSFTMDNAFENFA